ncbi:proteasome inhibitor subunit 1, partial [Homo sapiens]
HPHTSRQPPWCDPLGPFVVGGEDLDPFGPRRGGMIVDPLRSGFPRALIDPSSGLPNRLPPGAVPPGARFDPFGPIGTSPPGAGVKMSPAKCLEYQIHGDVSSLGNTRQPQRQLWSESCRFREDTVTS